MSTIEERLQRMREGKPPQAQPQVEQRSVAERLETMRTEPAAAGQAPRVIEIDAVSGAAPHVNNFGMNAAPRLLEEGVLPRPGDDSAADLLTTGLWQKARQDAGGMGAVWGRPGNDAYRLNAAADAARTRADSLTRERRDILSFNPAPTQEQRNRVSEIDREREALRQRSGQLREDAQWAEYGQLRYQPDFSANSSRPRSALDDMRRRVGGETVDERYLVGLEHAGGVGSMEWIERARQLTDEELAVYNYLRNTEGQESADAYLDLMEEKLNQRVGGKQAEAVSGIENPLLRTAATGLYAVGSGLDQFGTGVRQLFTEEALPTTATQFGAAQVREDLADASPSIGGKPLVLPGGASLGQAAFDLVSSAANMAPGLALSAATAGAGAAPWLSGLAASGSLGASAGGNAYNEAVKQGYTPAQARSYAILTGASEGGLQYLLGGIGALGGRVSRNVIQNTVKNIDNALLRAGAELGLNMLSEGAEEYLQEVLTPVFRNIALDENNPVELVSEEAIYAGILGALSAGVLEGPGQIADIVSNRRSGRTQSGPRRATEPGRAAEEFSARAEPERAAAGSAGPVEETGGAVLTAEDVSWILSQVEQASTEQGQNSTAASTGETAAHRMTMEDFTNVDSPVWNNVAYEDTETQRQITQRVHQEMVDEGAVVTVPESTREQVGQSYPDLRDMKKAERTPILRQKMKELKGALRQFLNGLKGGTYEFEVNGNILEARLYDTGVREVLEKIDQSKASMLYHSDQVFQNARYLYSTPDYDGDPNIYRWNYFYTPVRIGDETVGVRIAVRDLVETRNGRPESQIYNWGIKTGATLDGGRPSTKPPSSGVSSAAPDGMTLGTSASSVNPSMSSIPQSGAENNINTEQSGPRTLPAAEEIHIADRTWQDASSRKVNAFQYDHPELRPYYQSAARALLSDLSNTVKGERFPTFDQDGYVTGYTGVKRSVSEPIEQALDNANLSYAQIRKAAEDLIADNGQENYAAAKKLELILDQMLSEGYTDAEGRFIPADEAYIALRDGQTIDGGEYRMSEEEWNSIMGQEPTGSPAIDSALGTSPVLERVQQDGGDGIRRAAVFDTGVETPQGDVRELILPGGVQEQAGEGGGPLYDKGPESSVGAARSGFDPWSAFQLTRSEFFPEGANAARPVDVPTTDPQGRRIRKTASTAMGAKAIPDEVVGDIQNMVLRGELSYTRRSDKASVENAIKTIGDKGFQRALEDFSAQVRKGYVSKDMATLGQQLLINAANAGDSDATAEILSLYAQMETSAGQAVQAASILRKLDPSSQLYAARRAVSDLEAEIKKEFKDIDITIDQALIDEFDRQTDQAGRDAVLDRIKDNVAAQVPSTWQDKWNAWRYLAMLSNPRTHVRNFSGNVFFQPLRITKDRLAAAIEAGVSKATGGKVERTKTFLADKNLYKAAWHDWENVRDVLSGNRYDDLKSEINSRRTIYNKGLPTKALETLTGRTFKRGILENVRTANSWTLEIEDTIFKRFTYTDALAGYLQAHGVTAEQLRGGTADSRILSAARDYAGREALKATYQDRNQFSDYISSVGRGRNVPGWAKVVTEGVLPFRRTPANILMRGLEYSPAGLAKALTYDLAQVKRGKKTAAEVIDNIAAGLTGSTLFGLGMYLFAQGIVTSGGGDDEGQDQLDEQEGRQAYALNLPGGDSITLDWLAPESLPFFMGVEWMESIGESGITAEGAFDSFASAASPMLELSMLQSLNDLIDSVSFADSVDKVPSVVISALISYFTQAIPTIGGQFERSAEDNRMTTYTDKNLKLPTDIQYALGKASARIPGWDYQQIPYVDGWGRTESSGHWLPRAGNQFINPSYTSSDTSTPAIQETRRLYEETGDGGVVSKRPEKEITVDGQTKYLNAGEYLQYASERGQMRDQLVTDIIGRDAYQDMGAAEQAAVIKDVYSYTDEVAKSHISEYEPSSWVKKVESYGVDPADAILYRAAKWALEDADVEGVTQELRSMLMADASLSSGEKAAIDKAILSEKSKVDYSSQESFLISQMSDAAQRRWPGIRDRFGLSAEEYQEAVRIYNMDRDDGVTTADKKRMLREMFGWEGNAIYKALGKKADSDEED